MTKRTRAGFSIFDLVIVIAILGLLLALLLPAVAKVRHAADRTRSQNNLKQLGIAVHNYASAYRDVLPAGNDANNLSVLTRLLPFIEQEPLFRQVDFKKSVDNAANAKARKEVIPHFLSPLDPVPAVTEQYGATNYLFNAGSKPGLAGNDGVFRQGPGKYTIGNIPDGTSNTLMTVEVLKGDGGKQAVDVRRQHVALDANALKDLTEASGAADFKDGKNIASDRGASWMDGRFLQTTFTATRAFNDERPDVNCAGVGGLSGPRSLNTITIIGLCDGSVRTVSDTMSLKTWKLLAQTDDGQVLPNDF